MSNDQSVAEAESSSDGTPTPLLSIDEVSVEFENNSGLLNRLFGDPNVVRAVSGVSAEIHEQDVLALVGESGCGKTTLGKTSIGLIEPTRGQIRYRGQDINETRRNGGSIPYKEIRRSLQIIHQDPGSSLNPNQKIVSTLALPLKKWSPDLGREERRNRIYSLLDRVGMTPPEDFAHRYPHQLSGGEKQRVALIRALLMNPDLILADEAISALDVSLRVEMMDLMLELQEVFNTSYLFISHDLSNARYLAEQSNGQIGVMYMGEIVEIGSVDQIMNNPQHPYTKILLWATPDLDPAEDIADPPIRSVDVPDPTNPPSGCRFHTRCPYAREACAQTPPSTTISTGHRAACFRAIEDHEYWKSPSIDAREDALGEADD